VHMHPHLQSHLLRECARAAMHPIAREGEGGRAREWRQGSGRARAPFADPGAPFFMTNPNLWGSKPIP
jgi:hypothetical protein